MATTRTVKLVAKLKDNMSSGLKHININTAAVATALTALVAATVAATKKLADYGAKIFDIASATGLSVDAVQSLGYAFDQTGGSVDSMSGAIRGLNTFMRTAATGGAEYMEVLDRLGLSYDDLRAMSPEDAFLTLTDRIGGITNAMEKNIAATTVFGGRYAQQIVGALDQAGGSLRNLTDQFEATGNAMSGDQINTMKAFSDSMTDVGYGAKSLAADALVPLMPQLDDLISKALEIGQEVAPGVGTALSGVIDVVVILTNAFQFVTENTIDFNNSLGSTGDIANWVVNPLGAATGALLEFFDAAAEADRALRQWDDAAEQAAVTEQAATLITALYADAISGTADEAAFLIQQLESLEAQGANVGGILDNLRDRHESLTHAELLAGLEAMTLEENTAALTQSQIEAAQSAIDMAVAKLKLQETLAVGPTVIAAQIAELQRYRDTLDELSSGGGGGSYGPSETDVEEGIKNRETITKAMKAAAVEEFEAQADNEERLQDIQQDRIRRIKDEQFAAIQLLAEQQAVADAEREVAIAKAQAATESFGNAMFSAAIQGGEAWGAFWIDFRNQIIKTVSMKAFTTLLNFIPGVGSVLGFLGFAGGTPSVPGGQPKYGAAGGMRAVPGSPGMQSDGVPIMAKPGEVVLNRSQVNQMGRGGSTYNVNVAYSPMFSSASNADISRMVPMIKKAIIKGGGSW